MSDFLLTCSGARDELSGVLPILNQKPMNNRLLTPEDSVSYPRHTGYQYSQSPLTLILKDSKSPINIILIMSVNILNIVFSSKLHLFLGKLSISAPYTGNTAFSDPWTANQACEAIMHSVSSISDYTLEEMLEKRTNNQYGSCNHGHTGCFSQLS